MKLDAFTAWLAATSLWLIAITLLVAMIIAYLAGYAVRQRHERKRRAIGHAAPNAEDREGYVLSSVLGLLALLMGFTFALAIDRFETRRTLVLEEANAIGTTYLRAQLLDEPHRSRISKMLVAYTDNRVELGRAPPKQARNRTAANDALVTDLWTATVAAFPTIRGVDFSSSFVDSMNQVIDLDASRKASRHAKVPYAVFFVLFVYIVSAAGVLGYTVVGHTGRAAAIFLFALLTLSLMLIIDIDRPATGGINESQRPMEDLRDSLAAQPPEVFDRLNATGATKQLPAKPRASATSAI